MSRVEKYLKRTGATLLAAVCVVACMPVQEAKATDGYYYWEVTSKTNMGTVYDGWVVGTSGGSKDSASTVTFSVSNGISVSNSISGSYTSKSKISASLGFNVTASKNVSASYSVSVDKGYKATIKYRKAYTKYKVVETQYYKIDGYSSKTGSTKTCYVKKYSHLDYTSTKTKL